MGLIKKIALGNDEFAYIDDIDLLVVAKYGTWYLGKRGYAVCDKQMEYVRTRKYLHHLIADQMGLIYIEVDHINRYKQDCRRENLRAANRSQNGMNRSGTSSSGYKGVYWCKRNKGWQAKIELSGVSYYLGTYTTREEAARVYDKEAMKLFGTFAYLNFPESKE